MHAHVYHAYAHVHVAGGETLRGAGRREAGDAGWQGGVAFELAVAPRARRGGRRQRRRRRRRRRRGGGGRRRGGRRRRHVNRCPCSRPRRCARHSARSRAGGHGDRASLAQPPVANDHSRHPSWANGSGCWAGVDACARAGARRHGRGQQGGRGGGGRRGRGQRGGGGRRGWRRRHVSCCPCSRPQRCARRSARSRVGLCRANAGPLANGGSLAVWTVDRAKLCQQLRRQLRREVCISARH